MQVKFLIFSVFCLMTVAACHHHEGEDNAPVISISTPAENAAISGEVHIEGNVSDEGLHEMEIKVTRDSDGSELFSATPEVHDKSSFDFHEHWTPAVAAETAVTLTVTAEDHSDNSTTKTVKFTVKP